MGDMGDDVPASEAGERLLEDFLADPRLTALDLSTAVSRCATAVSRCATAVDRCATAVGLDRAVVYLADVLQRHLISLTDVSPPLPMDTSFAGWSYRTLSLPVEESSTGGVTVWLPLVDGAERVGVLAAYTMSLHAERLRHCRALAAFFAMMITSRPAYRDALVQRTRTEQPVQLPAELLRAVPSPRTTDNVHVVPAAVLEPAYEIGGDAFDHALNETTLHAAILDATGHNMASGLTTAVTPTGCRNGRRTGAELPEPAETVGRTLAERLPDQFCTGVLSQPDLMTGALRWCTCGHPQRLLIRIERLLHGALECPADPPMGLTAAFLDVPRHVHKADLEPGDNAILDDRNNRLHDDATTTRRSCPSSGDHPRRSRHRARRSRSGGGADSG
ncbi:PP2C family protein-serine/threonine phosphatase [Streptomyces sp. NPDC002577]